MKESESGGRAATEGERKRGDQSPMARGVVTLERVNGQEPNLAHFPSSSPPTTVFFPLLRHTASSHTLTLLGAILHLLIARADLHAGGYKCTLGGH